jgi:heavy metal sensor kinase
MKPRAPALSIRVRLTLWYAVVLGLMLIVYAAATYIAVRHEFLEQLDDQLHDDFETAEDFLTRTPDGGITWNGDRHHAPDEYDARVIDVWSTTGERMHRSGASINLPPATVAAGTSRARYDSIVVDGQRWRALTGTTMADSRAVVLRVARSEERLRNQLREILVVLVLGLPVVVVLAAAGGYVLARRALAPIDHLASETRRITADRLHERLSVNNPNDEIGRLTAVINETFARLQSSFDRLRRFTADASHELRTPLAVICGIGEAGLGERRAPAEYREAMGSMLEEVDRLTSLVDTLLRLSHADAGTIRLTRESIDLGQLTSDVVSSLAILAEERNQRLAVTLDDHIMISVDRLVLREAVTNIVDNAIKYSPAGSTIDVSVRSVDGRAVLAVADAGPGIALEYRERIFDRFFRADEGRSRDRGGTGLGLAIAKWAVEINGGHISVTQRPTGGSVFRIVIPLAGGGVTARHPTVNHSAGGQS